MIETGKTGYSVRNILECYFRKMKTLKMKCGRPINKFFAVLLTTSLFLIGCASDPAGTGSPHQIGVTPDAGRAVVALLAKAERQEYQAHWEQAAALLERALRIKPRNARLWHRLAKIRLQQGRYAMAESLAQKSTALAKDDEELKHANAELIEAARGLASQDKTAG